MPRKGFATAVTWLPAALEDLDDAAPARRVGEGAVDQDDGQRGVEGSLGHESSFLSIDIDDRLGEGLRRVLRHVVADAGPRTSPRRTPGRDAARRWRRLRG